MDEPPRSRNFATTHWSLVVAAGQDAPSQSRARAALEELCQAYWFPLYAFVRNRGYSPADAQDLTQSFFARLIENRAFSSADPERGRFRSYLLGALKHFLANQRNRAKARKRGGGHRIVELDGLDPETRYALEPAQPPDPDAAFDREWARESVARGMRNLQREAVAKGKGELFRALEASLFGQLPPTAEAAAGLGMTAGALKVALHRLRQRFQQLLRAEIAQTVSDPSEIDEEMRYLVEALRKNPGGRWTSDAPEF